MKLRSRYVARGFDWSSLTEPEKDVLLPAMDALRFPAVRIKRKTGKRVPIKVADLSRFTQNMDANGHGHAHEGGEHAHLLGEPNTGESCAEHPGVRRAPLGLYWLPTAQHPAGRIEVGAGALSDPDLAREVLLAEAAHAVDYGALTERQRLRIEGLFEYVGSGQTPVGWFEELGEQDYWAWRGERWMGLFMAAFAPELPRPLEARQPWEWTFDESDVKAVRRILRRP